MRFLLYIVVVSGLLIFSCKPKKTTTISYPEKFEGLTQLVLASETKTLVFSETSVQKVLGFKLGSAEVKVTASVTFDFYVDFDKDGYKMSFNATGDTLTFKAPLLRVKKPVINSSNVTYPEKSFFINEEEKAVEKLQALTDEFTDDGEELLHEQHVIDMCKEMLIKYLMGLCKEMGYPVKVIFVKFPEIAT